MVGEMNGNVVYREESNTVYFVSGSEIYSFPNMTPPHQRSGYLPISSVQNQPTMLAGTDLYVCSDYDMLIVRQLDQTNANPVLKLAGGAYGAGHTAFILNHPEIDLLISEAEVNTSFTDLATGLVTNNDMPDVITLSSIRNPLERIYSKGYAADLSGHAELVEMVSKINPILSAPLMQDGKLYAVPTEVYGTGLGYVPQTLEQLGLTTDDLPETYLELFDFMANFQADYGDDHPDISLFNTLSSQHALLSNLMNQYAYQQLKDGEDIKFDTPLMRKLLAAYEQIDFTLFDPYAKFGEDVLDYEERQSFYEKEALFTSNASLADPNAFKLRYGNKPLMLGLDDGMQPIAALEITVMIVNAKAANLDAAALYLTESLKNCDTSLSFALYSDFNAPIPNPEYETNVAKITADIEKVKRAMENASAENKAEYQDKLFNLEGELQDNEQRKMLFSEGEIAQYREQITPYLYAASDWAGGAGENINSLVEQYKTGAIDMDMFIREMDKRMNMIRMEE